MISEEDYREIKGIMQTNLVTLEEEEKVITAAKIMAKKSISCIIVVKGKKPIGIITERDLLKKLVVEGKDPTKTLVKEVMSKPVVTVPPESDFVPTGELMKRKGVRRFPVVDDNGNLIGLVTQTDILEGIIRLVKHLDWKLVTMKISVEEYIEKLKESRII
ncbi:MAG: CBS domain-containing protein [Candidatus Woesearchaeota archaeon]